MDQADRPDPEQGQRTGTSLKQVITVRHAVALYVSSVLGAGILVTPGLAGQIAGPASLLAWVLLSFASYPFAYTFANLSARRPESGGIYAFTRESFGAHAATVVAWLFVAWVVFGAPAITLAAGSYLSYSLPLSRPEVFAVALGIIFCAYGVNFLGIRFSGRVQLAVVVSIVALLLLAVAASVGSVSASSFSPFMPEGVAAVGTAAALVFWSYLGYENVSNVAEEFKDPRLDFNRSVIISVVLVGTLYIAVAVVTVGTGAYRQGGGVTPFAVLMSHAFGSLGGAVVSALAVFMIFGAVNAYTAGMARVVYAAAKDGSMPRALGTVDKGSGVPRRALLALLLLILLSFAGFYAFNFSVQTAFLGASGAAILTYIVGSAAGVRLLKEKGLRRVLPVSSLVVSVVVLPFIGPTLAGGVAAALLGLAYSFAVRKEKPR